MAAKDSFDAFISIVRDKIDAILLLRDFFVRFGFHFPARLAKAI